MPDQFRIRQAAILSLVLSFFIYSCSKEDIPGIEKGRSTVIVNLLGVESNPGKSPFSGATSSMQANTKAIKSTTAKTVEAQTKIIPFSDNLSIRATLTPQTESTKKMENLALAGKSFSGKQLSASPVSVSSVQKELDQGVQYRVVVYDTDGDYVDDIVYSYGQETSTPGFELDGGTYSFIVYSTNSATNVPDVTGSTLSASLK